MKFELKCVSLSIKWMGDVLILETFKQKYMFFFMVGFNQTNLERD